MFSGNKGMARIGLRGPFYCIRVTSLDSATLSKAPSMTLTARDRLRLSDRAQAKIRDVLRTKTGYASALSEPPTVRLYAERAEGGTLEIALAFDPRRETDYILATEGVTLVADPLTADLARDGVLDYEAEGFTFASDGLANPVRMPNSSN